MKSKPVRIALAAGALIAIGIAYRAYSNRPQPNNPDWLLKQADEKAWLNAWIEAAPIYRKAEVLYEQRHEPAKALYAKVSETLATSEFSSLPDQIWSLSQDLNLPGARDSETRLRILTIQGMLETNYDAGMARTTWEKVRALALKQHRYMLASRATGEEGIADFLLGDIDAAKKKVATAWAVAKYLHDPAARVRYASVFGAGLVELGRYQEALQPLNEAIRVANTTPGMADPSIAIASKIEALGDLGRYQEALALADASMSRVTAFHLKAHEFELLWIRAGIYERSGHTADALTDYKSAVNLAKEISYWRGLTQVDGLLAALYEQQGSLDDALRAIDEAIDANKHIPDELYFLPRNLAIRAGILARQRKKKKATSLYQKSADLIDALLAHVPTPGVERDLITSLGDVYSGYFNLLCGEGDYTGAFRVLEKARGRIETQSLEHVEAIVRQTNDPMEKRIARLNIRLLDTDNPVQRAGILYQITDVEEKQASASLAGRTADNPVSLSDLQADLIGKQLFLEYVLGDPHSYLLAVTHTGVHRYVLPARVTIERKAGQYRVSILHRTPDQAMGRTLFQQLLGNILEYHENAELMIIPDGNLHLLPFGALIDGNHYVVESHTVAISPSGTVFHILKARQRENPGNPLSFLGVAAWTRATQPPLQRVFRAVTGPEEDKFVPLPESKREVKTVAADVPGPSTILLGSEATETRFKQLPLGQYNVLHLALHGYANVAYPDRSALVFAPEKDGVDDGLLQVREIRNLRLHASLVTLSACDTGVGPVGQAGVNDIVNAFIDAGARSVVSTLWALEDHATTRLMIDFYGNMKQGNTESEAMQRAKIDLIRAGFGPYFWASFEVVGDPDVRLSDAHPDNSSSTRSAARRESLLHGTGESRDGKSRGPLYVGR